MPWAKLDDQFHAHQKAKLAWRTPRALGLHLLAMSYCAGLVTDGLVDDMFIEEKVPAKGEREKTCAALVDAGLWRPVEGGYEIHDWLDYNPSKGEVEERRRKDRERKKGKDSNGIPRGILADSNGIPSGVLAEPPRGRAGGSRRAGAVVEPQTINEKEEPQGSAIPASFSEVMEIGTAAAKKRADLIVFDSSILSVLVSRPGADHIRAAHDAAADAMSGRRTTAHFHLILRDILNDQEQRFRPKLKAVDPHDEVKAKRAAAMDRLLKKGGADVG